MTTALGCIYGLGMLFFSGAFLVDWFRSREQTRKYLRYGVWVGLVVVGLDLLILVTNPSSGIVSLLGVLAGDAIVFIRVIGFTILGMYYCSILGYPSFPLLLNKFGLQDESATYNMLEAAPEINSEVIDEDLHGTQQLDSMSVDGPQPETTTDPPNTELSPIFPNVNWRAYTSNLIIVVVIGVVYSVILFLLVKPQLSETVKRAFGVSSIANENVVNLQSIIFVLVFAVSEEIFFRLGIQNFLAKYFHLQSGKYWIAIFITTVFWTLGHVGILVPEWVKLMQVFPVGLLLGWLFKKHGVESSILAHGLFNIVLLFASSSLIT